MKTKEVIKTLINQIRSAKKHLSVPSIVGQGWTVTISNGKTNFKNLGQGKYNFAGRWSDGTYYTEHDAINLRDHIQTSISGSNPSIAHINNLCKIQLEADLDLLRQLLPYRNA